MTLHDASSIASLVTTLATVLTLAVLVWYTIETYKIRVEAQRQTSNDLMPVVVLELRSDPGLMYHPLGVRNIGRGPAFSISFSPGPLLSAYQQTSSLSLRVSPQPILAVDSFERIAMEIVGHELSNTVTSSNGLAKLAEIMTHSNFPTTFDIDIQYVSIDQRSFRSSFQLIVPAPDWGPTINFVSAVPTEALGT